MSFDELRLSNRYDLDFTLNAKEQVNHKMN